MAHHGHGHGAPAIGFEPFAHALRIIPGRVHDLLAGDVALGCVHNPFPARILANAGGGAETLDPRAHLPCTLGEGLRQLCGVDIAIVGVPEAAGEVMGFEKGIGLFHVVD